MPDSELGELLGGEQRLGVKSYHHQAVDELGDGLRRHRALGDGIIQAVELPGAAFGVAVQWHPEEDAAEDARLFAGLVDAARSPPGVRAS